MVIMYYFLSTLLNCRISDTKNAKSTTEFKNQQIQEQSFIKHNDVDAVATGEKSPDHILLKIRDIFFTALSWFF